MTDYFFFGLPGWFGEFLITSKSSIEYRASLLMGFLLALWRRSLTALGVLPDRSAISATVKNSIPLINIGFSINNFAKIFSRKSSKMYTTGVYLLYKRIVKLTKKNKKTLKVSKNACIMDTTGV